MDASVLVPLFIAERRSDNARDMVVQPEPLLVSVLARAEVAATISSKLRALQLSEAEAAEALASFDGWVESSTERVSTRAVDISIAANLVRRFDLQLRAPDAIHVATALRLRADLATFDVGMARAARVLGVTVLD